MNHTILVVEDDIMVYDRLHQHLSQWGFEVLPYAPSYEEAVALMSRKPGLAVLDIHLQGEKTGYDVARYIRQHADIPFLFLTVHSDDLHFVRALDLGPENFIDKTDILTEPEKLKRQLLLSIRKTEQDTNAPTPSAPPAGPALRGLRGYKKYLSEMKSAGLGEITEYNVPIEQVMYITTDRDLAKLFELDLRTNYSFFVTEDGNHYLTALSLSDLDGRLPDYFVRINDKTIINLLSDDFDGLINKSNIRLNNHVFHVSKTYLKKFHEQYNRYFLPPNKNKRKNR